MTEISCEKVRNYVDAIATPDWTPEWLERIARHSDGCEECRFAVSGAELLDARLRMVADPAPGDRMAASILERTERIALIRQGALPAEEMQKESLAPRSSASLGIWRPIAWGAVATGALLAAGAKIDGPMNADVARWLEPFVGWTPESSPLWTTNSTPLWSVAAAGVATGVFLLTSALGSPREE